MKLKGELKKMADIKNIVELEAQKIALEEQLDNLSYFKSFDEKTDIRIQEVEKKLNEIKDTINKLKETK
jgi:SpoVK/Ycf46/Vps4 family AAA+-type ATPase